MLRGGQPILTPRYQIRYGHPVWHVIDTLKPGAVFKGYKTLGGATRKAIKLNKAVQK